MIDVFREKPEQNWRRPIAIAFGFGLIALAVMVGALGIAAAVVITTILALPPWRDLKQVFPLDLSHSAFLIFIAWAWASTIWSPYEHTTQALLMVSGALLYPLFAFAVFTLEGKARQIAVYAALFSGTAMLAPYLLEGTTGAISHFYTEQTARENMLRDATRGISAIVMASPALAALWMLNFKDRKGHIIAGALVVLVALICWQFHLFAGLVALIAGGLFFALGYFWPRTTILAVMIGFLIMVLMAPMILPAIAAPLDGATLPFSWEWRVKMWPYTGEQINIHPLVGWGLDASRSFAADQFELHGFSLGYLIQHPHNVGLQIWLETGLIGALLLSISIALFGIRISGMQILSRMQGAAIAGSAIVFLVFFSFTYGAWQEWLWASVAWVSAMCVLTGDHNKPRMQS